MLVTEKPSEEFGEGRKQIHRVPLNRFGLNPPIPGSLFLSECAFHFESDVLVRLAGVCERSRALLVAARGAEAAGLLLTPAVPRLVIADSSLLRTLFVDGP